MELARIYDGKKFMWDGRAYDDVEEMRKFTQRYQNDGFEVREVKEGSQYFLFTRRVATEVVVEGKPI